MRAIQERNRLREALAAEMDAQRASMMRGVKFKKLLLVGCFVGAGAAAAQRMKAMPWPKPPKLFSSPEQTKKLLTEIKEQLADPKRQLITEAPPPRPIELKNEYDSRPAPPYAQDKPRERKDEGYGAPSALELELIKMMAGNRPKLPPPNCSSYFALNAVQAAGLPPQYQKARKSPELADYEQVTLVPIRYSRDENEFPK